MKTIDLITRCMKRRKFLEMSLPSWMKVGIFKNIIIVDWGGYEHLEDLCGLDDRIVVIKVSDQPYFEMGATKNVGARFSKSDYIFFNDCDVMINDNFKFKHELISMIDGSDISDLKYAGLVLNGCGPAVVKKSIYSRVNGFTEGFIGWGYDDNDFLAKVNKVGGSISTFSIGALKHLDHDESKRIENFEARLNKFDSLRINKKLSKMSNGSQIHQKYECIIYTNKGEFNETV